MFEQSIIAGAPKKRRVWTIALSLTGQIVAMGVAVLIPLVVYDQLPLARLAPKLGLPQPPPGKRKPAPSHVKVADVQWQQVRSGRLIEPVRVPERAQMIVDPAPPSNFGDDDGDGIEGGIEGAATDRNSVVGSILNAVSQEARLAPPPPVAPRPAAATAKPTRITLGGRVVEAKLIHRVVPNYPALARQARVSGVVRLRAVISRDGRVQEISLLSGHPLLIRAAVDAVRQWLYQPTMLNGEPVEVDTEITVTFYFAR
jgi:protein TonB